MYAVIETGGKQYRVQEGDVLDVERIAANDDDGKKTSASDKIVFERVLMVGGAGDGGPKVGDPVVSGASVAAVRVGEVRGPKIIVFKKKRRKGYRRKNGHRQNLLRVRIESIDL